LDSSVQVFDFAAWLPETELALFRVELPEKVEETGEKSKLERKASKMSRRKSLGTGVKFGQRLLLRHLHSSRLLSLTHEHAANSPGAFQVLLSSPRTEIIADIALQPINKLQKLGEPVRYRDKLQVLFLFGGIRYNMHCAKLENGFEVHGSHRVTTWTFEKYDKFEVNPESLRTEMPFLIQLQRFSLHITPKRKDRNEIHPQSDATDIEDKADAFLVTDRDDYAGYWVVEKSQPLRGGALLFSETLYLRNLKSGLYLTEDLKLAPQPDPMFTFTFPKPDSFIGKSEVPFNYPVLIKVSGNRMLSPDKSAQKEEIMAKIVPEGRRGGQTEEVVVETHLQLLDASIEDSDDALFQLLPVSPAASQYMMQVSKLVPKIKAIRRRLEARRDALSADLQVPKWNFRKDIGELEEALQGCLAMLKSGHQPEIYEELQSIVVGLDLHKVLLKIAKAVFETHTGAREALEQDPDYRDFSARLFKVIWSFLLEIAADNFYASYQLERFKLDICTMVGMEKQLIGMLLTEIYRLVDPEMPDYEQEFKKWCDRLESVSAANIQEQTVFLKLIRGLCEVGDSAKLEYQRVCVDNLFRDEGFPMVQLRVEKGSCFVHFWHKSYRNEAFLRANPKLKADEGLLTETHKVYMKLESLVNEPLYVEYLYSALCLITTLCKGKMIEGKKYAREQLGLGPEVAINLLQKPGIPLKIKEACLLLVDTLVVSCLPYRSNTEAHGNDLCFSPNDVLLSSGKESTNNPIDFGQAQQDDIRFCLQQSLSLLLAKELPRDMRMSESHELLEYVKALLQLCYSLIDFEHCSGLYVRSLEKALAYFLVGLSDDQSPKLAREHWVVLPLRQVLKEADKNMVVRVQLNELLTLLVGLLTLTNRYLKRTKILEILRVCITDGKEDPDVADIIDPQTDLMRLKAMLGPRLRGPPLLSPRSLERKLGNRKLLLHGPSTKEYLFRAVLNWNSVSGNLKEPLIALIKQLFADSQQTKRYLSSVEIIITEEFVKIKQSLQQLKDQTDFTRLLVDAKYELHHMISWTALKTLNTVLETVTTVLSAQTHRTEEQFWKLQSMVRHLGFHRSFMDLWNLIMVAMRLHRNELPAMKSLKCLLCVFLLNFVRGNEKNRKSIKSLFRAHFYFMTIPQFAELIRELTDFEPLGTLDTTQFFSYILDSFYDRYLGSFTYIKVAIVNRRGEYKAEKQNIAARLVAARYHQLFSLNPRLHAEFLEILAMASIDNAPIIAQCRRLIPPTDLEALFTSSKQANVHYALLQYLKNAYLREIKGVENFKDPERVVNMVKSSLDLLSPLLNGEIEFYDIAMKGHCEQVFPKEKPLRVEKRRVKDQSTEVSAMLRLLSSGSRWTSPSGFLTELPLILKALDPTPSVSEFVSSVRAHLAHFSEFLLGEQNRHQDLDYQLLVSSLQKCLEALDNVSTDKISGEGAVADVILALLKSKKTLVDPEKDFNKLFRVQRGNIVKSLLAQGEEFYESLASTFYQVAFKGDLQIAKLPREEIARNVKMLRRIKRLFEETMHKHMYFAFMQALVPEDSIKKQVMNNIFLSAEIVDEAIDAVIKHEDYLEANAALGFLCSLLDNQKKDFQDRFQELIDRGEKSYYLFFRFKRELETTKQGLLEQSVQTSKRDQSAVEEKPSERQIYVKRALTFLQLCCDNCNLSFQNYIRSQQKEEGRADVDLVTEVALFVIDLREKAAFIVGKKSASNMIVKAIAALLDFVTGPCPENQVLLGNNVQVFLAINNLLATTQSDMSPNALKIHTKIIIFLHTLLEGKPDPSIYLTMVKFLDLTMMRDGIEKFHLQYVRGREENFAQEQESIREVERLKLKTNISQAIFLLKLQKQHPGHPELKRFALADKNLQSPMTFYLSYIGYVEIEKAEVIYEHYFPIPFKCKFLTLASRKALIMDINRSSHQKKIEDFMRKVDVYMREMSHQQHLSYYPALKKFTTRWQLYAKISFLLVLAINLQILFTFSDTLEKSIDEHPVNMVIITVMGILQLITYMVSFAFCLLEYFPNMLIIDNNFVKFEIDRYHRMPHNESRSLKDIYYSFKTAKENEESFESSLQQIFNNLTLYYNYLYFLISVVALYFPLLNSVLLLDIVKQNQELVNVLKSITVNARQLLLTGCLALVIVFLYSVFAFMDFQKYYMMESGLYCHDLLNCFTSTFDIGIRVGGIGSENIIQDQDYNSRMLFDMLFYLIIIIILLNITFGIIIDTFAQLRDQKKSVSLNINNVCYVCGTDRSVVEQLGKGWTYHFMCEHSPLAYLAFLTYIKEMPIVDCSGIEKYVKEMFERRDIVFMPTSSRLLRMRRSGVREDED